jgi:hypothetical protein
MARAESDDRRSSYGRGPHIDFPDVVQDQQAALILRLQDFDGPVQSRFPLGAGQNWHSSLSLEDRLRVGGGPESLA